MSYITPAECLQPNGLFSSLDTLDHCFNQAAYGNPEGNSSAPCNASTVSPLVQLFDTCMQNYCQQEDKELRGCPYTSISTTICNQDGSIYFEQLPNLCDSVSASVNADIGGIGVSTFLMIGP